MGKVKTFFGSVHKAEGNSGEFLILSHSNAQFGGGFCESHCNTVRLGTSADMIEKQQLILRLRCSMPIADLSLKQST